MNNLALSAGEMCDRIEAKTADTAAGHALKILNDGYNRYLGGQDPSSPRATPHVWSFLTPDAAIALWSTATGTIVGTPTAATLTSTVISTAAKFYDTMVGAAFTFDTSGADYIISGYTSATRITVLGDASGEGAADTFTITATGDYPLPDDFGGMSGELVYDYLQGSTEDSELSESSMAQIEVMRRKSDETAAPTLWATKVRAINTTGVKYDLIVNPTPDEDYVVNYQYRRVPASLSDSTSCVPLGPPENSLCILAAALAQAELTIGDIPGIHEQTYQREMFGAIARDQALFGSMDSTCNMTEV